MTKYIIEKKTKYPCGSKGVYYITKHFASPDIIGDLELKDAFLNWKEANAFMMEIIGRDYPYRDKGFEFEYEIKEID